MACVFGRARVTGQVIWAARFREGRKTSSAGKGGPRVVEYDYSLSFAVALCEGEIDGVGRVWADGRPMDLSGVTMRVHRGGADQTPDALIEAVEGAAPAYRGCAYVVFEDLPLGPYGNRAPQLAFEVFRRARGNAPNLKRVSLVIGWFGTDLRAGHCRVKPGVERRMKPTGPLDWSVAGLGRGEAHLISEAGGGPAYGGTPSDESVKQAVAALKARGLAVTLYPFVFMDVAPGNGLADPYGGGEQAAYPWRGRVKGTDGAGAEAEIAALFGAADGWGLRRQALHYAQLVKETGADGLLIGSEMRGVTWTRDASGGFPAVGQLKTLAAECRAVVGPGVEISYAADWSEYFGWRRDGEVRFHLDPLWADPNIDYVGIDWYPPLGDWRAEDGGVDAAVFAGADDPSYLAAQVAGGEGFDWFYASDADRAAQLRTPIADTAHGEDWLFRPKDLKGWWSHEHHDRPGGVRAAAATDWRAGMKPIRLTEFGCAAVDRGGNAPNLFQDPKSAETALPPHSTGERDDRMQRRALAAVLEHYADDANNPVSAVYGGRMLAGADAWCWDARPWPAFPGRADVWADAGAWRTGHWLNGRLSGETRDLIAALLKRGGLDEDDYEIGAFDGEVQGYVVDRPMRTRDALEPLLAALGLVAAERGGRVAVVGEGPVDLRLTRDAMALPDAGDSVKAERRLEPKPGTARLRFIDGHDGYQTGSVVVRTAGEDGSIDLDLPAVCSTALARAAAMRALEGVGAERLTVAVGPLEALRLEPADRVEAEGREGVWRVARIDLDETPSVLLEPVSVVRIAADGEAPRPDEAAGVVGAPFLRIMELPPLPGMETDERPFAVVAAEPWRAMRVFAGADETALTARADVAQPADVGQLVEPLAAGVPNRWDEANTLTVRVEGRAPESRSVAAVLGGANTAAVETAEGWELVQFREAVLVGDDVWRLSGLLRGQQGTEEAMGAETGAVCVFVGPGLERAESPRAERGLPLLWRAGPRGGPAGGAETAEVVHAVSGVAARPWRPVHLSVETEDEGRRVRWRARSRIDGDRWDGEAAGADPLRFRVRILAGKAVMREAEVEGLDWLYHASDLATDFGGGPSVESMVGVAQWGEGYGWGTEATAALS